MQKRTLEELNLIDDFLFNKMISHPEFGEEFARDLIRIILGKEVGKLKVVPQKVYYGSDTDTHGARLDVQTLKNVVVIFITPKDPLGANRMFYTIESTCKELPDLPYDDGAKTIFLYTKGTEGNPREELKELLSYMEDSCEENVKNDMLKKVHQMMRRVKSDEEVSIEYMKIFEREKMIREEGREEQARQSACKFFENGASYELVRASITLLSDEELQAIYDDVTRVKE